MAKLKLTKKRRYCTFVPPPPIVIDDSWWKNTAESFTVALTLTLGGYESAKAPKKLGVTAWREKQNQVLHSYQNQAENKKTIQN